MPGLLDPAFDVYDVTPSDTVDLPKPARALRVSGGAGSVSVLTQDGGDTPRTLRFLDGETRTVLARRVRATGTTGGLIIEAMV